MTGLASVGPPALRWALVALLVAAAVAMAFVARRSRKRMRRRGVATQPFLGHLEELRTRVLVVATVLFAGMAFAFGFRVEAWNGAWRPVPALFDNLAAQVFRALSDALVPPEVRLVVTSPLDGFMAELTIALGIGAVAAMPVLLWQAIQFVGPALQLRERRMLGVLIAPALVLFALGVAFGYLLVLPFLFVTLYSYSAALDAELLLRLQDFVVFSFGLLFVLGVAFQTPLVMVSLTRIGLVASATWLRLWRHALIAILVASALVTDPTLLSQIMVAVPLTALYFLGAGVARLVEARAS